MNYKNIQGVFASKTLVIVALLAMIATALPFTMALAHDGEHEGEHGATVSTNVVTVNTFDLEADGSDEDVNLDEVVVEVETDDSDDTPLDDAELKIDEGTDEEEEVPATTDEEVLEFDIDDESEETTTEEVVIIEKVQTTPDAGECEIEGHKYDQTGNPLTDWAIGLMKTVTQGESQDLYDLDEDTTDTDGYYCLNWDGETREFRGEGEPEVTGGEFSFIYSVYEKLVDGWEYLSIEKGADGNNLEVVAESEVAFDGDYVSTQIGEENGYIIADAAYHVDFYNKLIEEEEVDCADTEEGCEEDVVEENSSRSSGGGGTRVGDRDKNRSSNSDDSSTLPTPEPTPVVLGEQVSVVPVGAPGAGVGDGSLTFEQKLFVSERLQLLK